MELPTPAGRIYIHYIGKHPEYGDSVIVCPTVRAAVEPIAPTLFLNGFVVFYPVIAAVARGLAAIVGHLPSPGLPTRLRRPGVRVGLEVRTWIIEEPTGDVLKKNLSREDLLLPIAVIWNHEMLAMRVTAGWRPEMEGSCE